MADQPEGIRWLRDGTMHAGIKDNAETSSEQVTVCPTVVGSLALEMAPAAEISVAATQGPE